MPAGNPCPGSRLFYCDAGLGGLARWLRAAGHEALWDPEIDDSQLVREAGRLRATVLTTDSLLMERRVLRDGLVPAFWVPPTLRVPEQLALVFREFGLTVGEPRCMSCGGELVPVDKETMRERIPPKTWLWLDEYFVCSRCDQLFWKGTHWRQIGNQLSAVQTQATGPTVTGAEPTPDSEAPLQPAQETKKRAASPWFALRIGQPSVTCLPESACRRTSDRRRSARRGRRTRRWRSSRSGSSWSRRFPPRAGRRAW